MTCPRCPLCGGVHLTLVEAYRVHDVTHYRIFRDGSLQLWKNGAYREVEPPGAYNRSPEEVRRRPRALEREYSI